MLNMPRLRSIVADDSGTGDTKLVLLDRSLSSIEQLPSSAQQFLEEAGIKQVIPHTVTLDYKYYGVDAVLRRLLPDGMEIPSSFETVGKNRHRAVQSAGSSGCVGRTHCTFESA